VKEKSLSTEEEGGGLHFSGTPYFDQRNNYRGEIGTKPLGTFEDLSEEGVVRWRCYIRERTVREGGKGSREPFHL